MELRHLRYFVTLAKTLSFTQAAESLYISQSTLSQQIASLENELGLKLFNRTRRTVELTESGQALLEEAEHILAEVDWFGSVANTTAKQRKMPVRLRIGLDLRVMGGDLLRDTICNEITAYRTENPSLRTEFTTGEYEQVERLLNEKALDLAFFLHQQPTFEGDADIKSQCLYEDEFVVVVRGPHAYEDTPEGLRELLSTYDVTLLANEGHGLIHIVRLFDQIGIEPTLHFASSREDMLLMLRCSECANVLPLGIVKTLDIPDLSVLRFHCDDARLYVIAAQTTGSKPLIVAQIVQRVGDELKRIQ